MRPLQPTLDHTRPPFVDNLSGITAGQLLSKYFPDREHILEPWLRNEETALIWAASGVGKTMLALSIAIAIAGGGSLGEWNAPNPRRVLYIDGEMHQQDMRDRIRMLIDTGAVTVSDESAFKSGFSIIARQAQDAASRFYDLTDADAQDALRERCRLTRADVLIIDNFTTVSDGLVDENASTAFKPIQGFLLSMKQMGVTTILVHHARKDGKALRGSQSIEVTFETIVSLRKPELAKMGKASFILDFPKFRGEKDYRMGCRQWSLEEDGWAVTDDVDDDEADPIVKAVQSLRFASQSEIASYLQLDKSTVSRRIKKAEMTGALRPNEASDAFGKARDLKEEVDFGSENRADESLNAEAWEADF